MVGYIDRVKNTPRNSRIHRRNYEKMWDWALLMHESNVSQAMLDSSQVMASLQSFVGNSSRAMRLEKRVPVFLTEDLTMIFRKWNRGDFDSDPERGLIRRETRDQNGILVRSKLQLDPDWQHRQAHDFFGDGHLVNGQMFPSRLALLRDGAHGSRYGGISGTVRHGARSIVMGYHDDASQQYYADIDMHEVIEYQGTALPDNDGGALTNLKDGNMGTGAFDDSTSPTACTRMLMRSLETGLPVRVFRSCKAAGCVKNKPASGFRYDALYRVTRQTPQKQARQIWSFRMERLPGQGPLRGLRRPMARNTRQREGWATPHPPRRTW